MMNYIWHSVFLQIGIAGVAVIICGAVAWFIPPLRSGAIWIGGVILSGIFLYGKGARDENLRDRAKQQAAEDKSVADAKIDRARADRDLASVVTDGGNRDKQ
jgi:hypothetical protein